MTTNQTVPTRTSGRTISSTNITQPQIPFVKTRGGKPQYLGAEQHLTVPLVEKGGCCSSGRKGQIPQTTPAMGLNPSFMRRGNEKAFVEQDRPVSGSSVAGDSCRPRLGRTRPRALLLSGESHSARRMQSSEKPLRTATRFVSEVRRNYNVNYRRASHGQALEPTAVLLFSTAAWRESGIPGFTPTRAVHTHS